LIAYAGDTVMITMIMGDVVNAVLAAIRDRNACIAFVSRVGWLSHGRKASASARRVDPGFPHSETVAGEPELAGRGHNILPSPMLQPMAG
jgi:hypothetical protein